MSILVVVVESLTTISVYAQQVNCSEQITVGEFDTVETLNIESLENGYCNHYGNWIPAPVSLYSYFTVPPNINEEGIPIVYLGNTTRYNPGVMEQSASNNGVDLTGCLDGTAVMFGREGGQPFAYRYAYVRIQGSEGPWLTLCVADSVGREDTYHHVDANHLGNVLEVGARAAATLGMITLSPDSTQILEVHHSTVPIEVYFTNDFPPEGNVIEHWYSDWWRESVRFSVDDALYSYREVWEINPIP